MLWPDFSLVASRGTLGQIQAPLSRRPRRLPKEGGFLHAHSSQGTVDDPIPTTCIMLAEIADTRAQTMERAPGGAGV